jgi:hypothetical protein
MAHSRQPGAQPSILNALSSWEKQSSEQPRLRVPRPYQNHPPAEQDAAEGHGDIQRHVESNPQDRRGVAAYGKLDQMRFGAGAYAERYGPSRLGRRVGLGEHGASRVRLAIDSQQNVAAMEAKFLGRRQDNIERSAGSCRSDEGYIQLFAVPDV